MSTIKQDINAEKSKGVTLRFELRTEKADKDGRVPVRLIYQVKGVRKVHNTGLSLLPACWDIKYQQAIYIDKKSAKRDHPAIDYELFFTETQAKEFNDRLRGIIRTTKEITDRFILDKISFSSNAVIEKLLAVYSPSTKALAPATHVFDFIDKYIEDNKASREPGSMSVYRSLKNHLQNFQIKKQKKVTFDNIDYAFFLEFKNFLIHTKARGAPSGLGNVTIAKQLSTLKTFLNYARMHGIEVQNKYKDFKIKKESLEVIALTDAEFKKVYTHDLSGNRRLDQVRDVFCFACATGLRYSDIKQLKREHIKTDEIRLTVTKTKEPLVIPLNPYSNAILEKYSDQEKPLPVISNDKTNEYVKELCGLAGIDELVQIVRFRGSRRDENTYPKHKLVSCHTGRKTFATLSLEKGMSAELVMKIGGWKSYTSFKRYVNITEEHSKTAMQNTWGQLPWKEMKAAK